MPNVLLFLDKEKGGGVLLNLQNDNVLELPPATKEQVRAVMNSGKKIIPVVIHDDDDGDGE